MNTLYRRALLVVGTAIALGGCSSTQSGEMGGLSSRGGATIEAAPRSRISKGVMDQAVASSNVGQQRHDRPVLPNELVVPGTYRLVVVDGKTMLVQETDARKVLTSPAVQIIAADPMTGDLSIQPAILPQEVTEEIVRNRGQTDQILRALPQILAENKRLSSEIKQLSEEITQLRDSNKSSAQPNQNADREAAPSVEPPAAR